MATSRYTVTGTAGDLVGAPFTDPKTGFPNNLKARIETDLPAGEYLVDIASGGLQLGTIPVTLGTGNGGSFTVPNLIGTNNVAPDVNWVGFHYRMVVEYTDLADPVRKTARTPWFALTADLNIRDVVETSYAPPTATSELLTQMEALLAAQIDLSHIDDSDSEVAALFSNGTLGPLTRAALATSIDARTPVTAVSRTTSVTALRTVPGADYALDLAGYNTPNDGGGGRFFWDPTAAPADEDYGTLIVPTGATSGGWRRSWKGDRINARWFGADATLTDNTLAAQRAATFMANNAQSGSSTIKGGTLHFPGVSSYKFLFTSGTSGLSTITFGQNTKVTSDGAKLVCAATTVIDYFFTFTAGGARGAGGGVEGLTFSGSIAGNLKWGISLDCWRVFRLNALGENLYGGLLDANNTLMGTTEGENIKVVDFDTRQTAGGGPVARCGIRFRGSGAGVATSQLGSWSDVEIDHGIAHSIWYAAVEFDSVSRSDVNNVAASNNAAAYTNTIDGVTRSGCLHAVSIVNNAARDIGRNTVRNPYLESHSGPETEDVYSVGFVDSVGTGGAYLNTFEEPKLTDSSPGGGISGLIIRNTNGTAGKTHHNTLRGVKPSYTGFTAVDIGANVSDTNVELLGYGAAAKSHVVDNGTNTILNGQSIAAVGAMDVTLVQTGGDLTLPQSDATNFTDIPGLLTPTLPVGTYEMTAYGEIDGSTTADVKLKFLTSLLVYSGSWNIGGLVSTSTATTGSIQRAASAWSASPTAGIITGTAVTVAPMGLLKVTTAGTLKLQATQGTSEASDVKLRNFRVRFRQIA